VEEGRREEWKRGIEQKRDGEERGTGRGGKTYIEMKWRREE